MYESLHNHTTASDGPVDYLELLRVAQTNHYGVMAFTDHDVLPSEETITQLREYTGPVKWLAGVELSSGMPKELGGGAAQLFHILGLFVDPTNTALASHCAKAVEARTIRMEQMVTNLRSIGFDITVEDCLADSGGEAVGRRNISRALERSPRYETVMDRLRRQMAEEALEDPEVAMAYMRLLDGPVRDHPFRLFLSDDAYLDNVYVDYGYWADMDDSVKLIRDAGGIAILAHWPTIADEIPLPMLEPFVTDGRLDGIELRTGVTEDEKDRVEADLIQIVERTGTAATYGIDGHSLRVIEIFATKPLAERTVGQTAKLIERFKPNLSWSNLG